MKSLLAKSLSEVESIVSSAAVESESSSGGGGGSGGGAKSRKRSASTQFGKEDTSIAALSRVIRRLPAFQIHLQLRESRAPDRTPAEWSTVLGIEEVRGGAAPDAEARPREGSALIKAGTVTELNVNILVAQKLRSADVLHLPRYHKPKTASWWLVLSEGHNLLALKHVGSVSSGLDATLLFTVPEARQCYLSLQLVCDSQFGLDEWLTFPMTVTPK